MATILAHIGRTPLVELTTIGRGLRNPILAKCEYQRSLWEVKTVLPRSEADDSRPILFRPHHGLRGLHCVMGGKIDNVYDVLAAIASQNIVG